MDKQELINKLPTQWSEITLNQYIKLMNDFPILEADETMDDEYLKRILAIWFYHFTGEYMDECNFNYLETNEVINKLNTFSESADAPKIDVSDKIKTMNEVTYNDFITLVKLQDEVLISKSLKNYPQMINIMLKDPIDNIGEVMDMATANSFFLLLRQQLETYLNHSQNYLMNQIQQKLKVEQ